MTASVIAQGIVAVLDPTSYIAYNVIAACACLSLIPLTLTRATPPLAGTSPRLRPIRTMMVSPLGVFSVIVVGLTSSGFRMVGPIYAMENGLEAAQVAGFMAAGVGGGALAQWPMGWISDRFDRRTVLIIASLLACLVCSGIAADLGGPGSIYVASFVFGAATFPLYSLAAAHANDHAKPNEIVELNAALMFYFGVGAIVSPLAAAELIQIYGPAALFVYIAAAHVALVLFGLWRMMKRPAPKDRTKHRHLLRNSFTLGRLFRGPR